MVDDTQLDNSEGFIVTDFTAHSNASRAQPVHAAQMLEKLYEYYTLSNPNAQAIHHVAMIMKPLLGAARSGTTNDTPSDNYEPSRFKTLQEDAILYTYYDQLQSLQIHNPSVVLARDAQQHRHEPIEGFSIGSQIGLVCLDCTKPMNNPLSKFRCENCGKRQANCSICWQKYPAYMGTGKTRKSAAKALRLGGFKFDQQPTAVDHANEPHPDVVYPIFAETDTDVVANAAQSNHAILWQSCLVCGHGAHAACLQHIQNDPKIGGKCPTDGCLCDCIPGTYRMRLNREAEDTRRKGSISWVRGDTASLIGESGAVKGARTLLDREHRENSAGSSSIIAAAERPRQEEKRVRVVEPKSRRG